MTDCCGTRGIKPVWYVREVYVETRKYVPGNDLENLGSLFTNKEVLKKKKKTAGGRGTNN